MGKPYDGPNTYNEVMRFLNGADSRVWNNLRSTRFHKETDSDGNDCVCMEYWNTDVVTWLQNGDVIINTGGWGTKTTQHRLGAVTRVWGNCEYFEHGGVEYEMADGALLHQDGAVTGATPVIVKDYARLMNQDLMTLQECRVSLARLNIDNSRWVWNKLRRHRRWIAANCSEEFVPTLIGIEDVADVIAERMRNAA